jgi:ferric-dicitrate binding protein FerR (iron transport regulator)
VVSLKGEAYFEVQPDASKEFRVKTGKTITRVLGTKFNLTLENDNHVILIVSEGRVQFYPRNQLTDRQILTAGQKGEYRAENHDIVRSENRNKNYLSWKTGELIFNNTPLSEVCKTLSEYYDITLIATPRTRDYTLTGTFRQETIQNVLTTLEITFDIEVKLQDDTILLRAAE